jgi:parallel beta-helix repeat protein
MSIVIAVAAVCICVPAFCSATTYSVYPDGSGDFSTIQAAINASQDGDVIELGSGTFSGAGNYNLNFGGRSITVRSQAGDPEVCIVDCEGTNGRRGFRFISGESTASVLESVTVRRGYLVEDRGERGDRTQQRGAGVYCINSSPTLRNCVISENTVGSYYDGGLGGGMYCGGSSAPVIEDCIFRSNHAITEGPDAMGAGFACSASTSPIVAGCLFHGNVAWGPGSGGYCASGTAVFSECTFRDNVVCDAASPSITSCTFLGSGTLILFNDSSPTVEDCLFDGTQMGAYCEGGTPTFIRCVYLDNESGLWCIHSSQPLIVNCTLSSNGIGIRATYGSSFTLDNTIIAFSDGVSVECDETGSATLSCCDLYGNVGGDWTGCVADQYGTSGNFSDDPLFCDPAVGDFTLHADSPCAPENNVDCGVIGAWGVGCPETGIAESTEEMSWGSMKALFR